ncbi:putative MFS family arabinose efflux permease [Flavobacterium lacus]|uniref:Putative MFS family arabinose efflux permease n=2 Tax=Flavobacterium lacus TaxID=1353778 RepID=A0A328WRB9_9FLAO|nr:putative MFS family arabinose efflux permease [Flavobacterium lacus]
MYLCSTQFLPMLKTAFNRYINSFRGFRREIWILTLITFINRAGTMVLPFLSKYLKEDLDFSYGEVGWIMVCFGLGSMLGSYLGGKLSDSIGFYKVMVFSLFVSGLLFFALQFITSFAGLCVAMFVIMTVADMFRPAMFVSLGAYAKPENRTRALTLVRLAVNLGFAAGPALGGLIIMNIGYHGLFWVDGASCIVAISIFWILVKEKKKVVDSSVFVDELPVKSVYKDRPFWVFLIVSFITAMIFFQLFTTLPLYHQEQYGLTEFQTGLLMTLNGFLIFLLEMPIVNYFDRKKVNKVKIVLFGSLCMALSFYVLLINVWAGVLLINILFLTFGEMFAFPFSISFALSRAPRGQEGRYMAFYTMSFSLAHIMSSKTGMEVIAHFGYQVNWMVMGTLGLVAVGCSVWVMKMVREE